MGEDIGGSWRGYLTGKGRGRRKRGKDGQVLDLKHPFLLGGVGLLVGWGGVRVG